MNIKIITNHTLKQHEWERRIETFNFYRYFFHLHLFLYTYEDHKLSTGLDFCKTFCWIWDSKTEFGDFTVFISILFNDFYFQHWGLNITDWQLTECSDERIILMQIKHISKVLTIYTSVTISHKWNGRAYFSISLWLTSTGYNAIIF